MSSDEKDRVKVKVNADVKDETEEKNKKDEKVVNGKFLTKEVQWIFISKALYALFR